MGVLRLTLMTDCRLTWAIVRVLRLTLMTDCWLTGAIVGVLRPTLMTHCAHPGYREGAEADIYQTTDSPGSSWEY